jgi:glycosyltransferase involved in cell wall biosynthesis
MACGVPVIATDVGGNSEAVAHGVSGLIVPPEDHIALAAALLQLLSSPAELRHMSIAGRHRIQANFTAKAMMTRLSEAYTALLAS